MQARQHRTRDDAGPGAARGRRRRGPAWLLAAGLLCLSCAAARPAPAQEIYQAVLLDLTALEVQVIVVGAVGDEEVHCLLRDAAGRVRNVGGSPIRSGMASGRSTVLSIVLPLLAPGDREFAVAVMRDGTAVTQTGWRPLFR